MFCSDNLDRTIDLIKLISSFCDLSIKQPDSTNHLDKNYDSIVHLSMDRLMEIAPININGEQSQGNQ